VFSQKKGLAKQLKSYLPGLFYFYPAVAFERKRTAKNLPGLQNGYQHLK